MSGWMLDASIWRSITFHPFGVWIFTSSLYLSGWISPVSFFIPLFLCFLFFFCFTDIGSEVKIWTLDLLRRDFVFFCYVGSRYIRCELDIDACDMQIS